MNAPDEPNFRGDALYEADATSRAIVEDCGWMARYGAPTATAKDQARVALIYIDAATILIETAKSLTEGLFRD